MEEKIEQWFIEHFSVALIGGNTEVHNLCFKAKEELKKIMAEHFQEEVFKKSQDEEGGK